MHPGDSEVGADAADALSCNESLWHMSITRIRLIVKHTCLPVICALPATTARTSAKKRGGFRRATPAWTVLQASACAVLRASAIAVSDGFAEPRVGKMAGPTTYAFAIACSLPRS